MRKSLTIGVAALALTITACGRKTPPATEIPPATEQTGDTSGAAAGDVELTELPAMQADLVAKAGSDTVYFGTDVYQLDAQSQATLAAQAKWMLANPSVRASIEGHADERGTREYNIALGARRAQSVRTFLTSRGIDASRMRTISYGKERQVAVCNDISCWSQNRRVVTVLDGAGGV